MDRGRFCRKLDRLLDRAVDDVPAHELESVLQARAQDMREVAAEKGGCVCIDPEDCGLDEE